MKRFKVSVTQKHIKAGKRGTPGSCPIALALQEQLPSFLGAEEVEVYNERADICNRRVPLPPRAQKFVTNFDEFRVVKPFEFFLE